MSERPSFADMRFEITLKEIRSKGIFYTVKRIETWVSYTEDSGIICEATVWTEHSPTFKIFASTVEEALELAVQQLLDNWKETW